MKPKAPRWLTEAFRDGVDERYAAFYAGRPIAAQCFLAKHDPRHRPCSGRLERFHWISRQRIENAVGAMLLGASIEDSEGFPLMLAQVEREAIVLIAAWDSRNGGIACEGMHRRFDSHLTPPLAVPYDALPAHVIEFAADWGLEIELERKFPQSAANQPS